MWILFVDDTYIGESENGLAHEDLIKFTNLYELWVQNALIPRVLLISPDQNVAIIFVYNICIGNIRTAKYQKLYMKTSYSSKCL